jgi:hypothetical protein
MAKNPGWQNEPARHALAAKGVRTKHRGSERQASDYVAMESMVMHGLNAEDRKLIYEQMWSILDQMNVVWDDIDAPLDDEVHNWRSTAYAQHHDRIEDTIQSMRDIADRSSMEIYELRWHEARDNLQELVRLSIVLDDHGRFLKDYYPNMKSAEFGGNLGEHVSNNASYVRQTAENMLQQTKKYETRR